MVEFFKRVERYRGHLVWIGSHLKGWKVVLAPLAWGGGLTAMQMDQYVLAIGFFFATFGMLAIKAIATTKDRERTLLIGILAGIFFAGHVLWVLYTHKQFTEKARITLPESKISSPSPQDNEPQISVALLPQITEEPEKEANFEVTGFTILFHNKSSKIQHDISLILRTPVIRKVTLSDPTRIRLAGGGPTATYVHVIIAELPANGGHLTVNVEVTPTNTLSAQAWKDEYKWPEGVVVYRLHMSD